MGVSLGSFSSVVEGQHQAIRAAVNAAVAAASNPPRQQQPQPQTPKSASSPSSQQQQQQTKQGGATATPPTSTPTGRRSCVRCKRVICTCVGKSWASSSSTASGVALPKPIAVTPAPGGMYAAVVTGKATPGERLWAYPAIMSFGGQLGWHSPPSSLRNYITHTPKPLTFFVAIASAGNSTVGTA
jgi:hypothetical protein